jgi:hypothetical protein
MDEKGQREAQSVSDGNRDAAGAQADKKAKAVGHTGRQRRATVRYLARPLGLIGRCRGNAMGGARWADASMGRFRGGPVEGEKINDCSG